MLNVLFSTTRQWNVGDEFILFGAINLIKSVFSEEVNPIIYNRHPDLRTDLLPICDLKDIKLCAADELTLLADANFRVGFRDNSFKNSLDGQFLDLVVFAGTPEWSNNRCLDLYQIIEKYDLPVIALGIGNCIQEQHDLIKRNLDKFQLFTVRSPELINTIENQLKIQSHYLPCPSLCSSPPEKIRVFSSVKNIGLIYSCDEMRSEINNCVSTSTYNYLIRLFQELRKNNSEYHFSIVCHYVDELPYAHCDFPDMDIFYSFDAKDYYDIYHQFDLVIGARVHGIGCAASMGIPGICVVHDFRGETVSGFFAEKLNINQSLLSAQELLEYTIETIEVRNRRLVANIEKTAEHYKGLISTVKLFPKNLDNYNPPLRPPSSNIFEGRENLLESLRELRCIPNSTIKELNVKLEELENHIREQTSIIENQLAKINAQGLTIESQKDQINQQTSLIENQMEKMSEQDSMLKDQLAKIREQNLDIDTQLAQINKQKSTIGNQLIQIGDQRVTIEGQLAQINEQVHIIESQSMQLSEKSIHIKKLNDKVIEIEQEICFLQDQSKQVECELRSLYNSRSWKITAPLRKIFAPFRRLLKGGKMV